MKNNGRYFSVSLIVFLCLLGGGFFYAWPLYLRLKKTQNIRSVLLQNRMMIKIYHDHVGEFPLLIASGITFWDIQRHPCFLLVPHMKDGIEAPEILFNPISGKFDWFLEDASGTMYSPGMPGSVLIASPPIRVVNIRCPLSASDPPLFEDLTKW